MTDDLTLLASAARAAAPIAMRFWRTGPDVWHKPDDAGPVSQADLDVDRSLRVQLCQARPDYGWLSEESDDGGRRLSCKRAFIIDPIDGTRAFLAGQTSWALSLAVAADGIVEAGVVFLPASDRLYAARRGGGATLNGSAIAASGCNEPNRARILAARRMMSPEMWPGGVPPVQREFRPSLAYRMALVAEGRFDGMLSLLPSWEWDIAAGSLIAAEAGATVTDAAGAMPLFNNPSPRIGGILTAPPRLHAALLDRLRA